MQVMKALAKCGADSDAKGPAELVVHPPHPPEKNCSDVHVITSRKLRLKVQALG